jgi:hypothetical protein
MPSGNQSLQYHGGAKPHNVSTTRTLSDQGRERVRDAARKVLPVNSSAMRTHGHAGNRTSASGAGRAASASPRCDHALQQPPPSPPLCQHGNGQCDTTRSLIPNIAHWIGQSMPTLPPRIVGTWWQGRTV